MVSISVIGYVDWQSLLYLLVISHVSYYVIKNKKSGKYLYRTAFLFIALLMVYKFVQVALIRFSPEHMLLLLGISYFTFRISAMLFDSARGTLTQVSYLSYMHFCLFFPIFVGGPVQRYNLFCSLDQVFYDSITSGLMRILRGIIKKLLFADMLLVFLVRWTQSISLQDKVFQVSNFQWATAKVGLISPKETVLLFGFLCIIRAYFDLSALTDIAIGLSECFGYKVSENFNKPLLSVNIIEFWRRWHMTIANWARDYVFSPFLLATRNIFVAVFATMICVGMWHQPSVRWLIWGIGHGVGLILCGAWQRTNISRKLQDTKMGLLNRDYIILLPNIIRIAKERNFSVLYRLQFTDVLSFPAYSIAQINITQFMKFFIKSVFNVPAWILNFSYMSFIFIAVSCPTFSEAMKMYAVLFGFRS